MPRVSTISMGRLDTVDAVITAGGTSGLLAQKKTAHHSQKSSSAWRVLDAIQPGASCHPGARSRHGKRCCGCVVTPENGSGAMPLP